MSNTLFALLPPESHVSRPQETNYAKIVAINNDTVGRIISTTVITNPPPLANRRRNANNASRNSPRNKLTGNMSTTTSSSPSPETLNRIRQNQNVRRSRKMKRKNTKKEVDSGAVSPSAISVCSLASIATTSSGLSSNASSIRALNDAVQAIACSDPVEKLSSSSAASSAGFCDMTSTDGADEDDFSSEPSGWWNYCEDPSLLDPSFSSNATFVRQYSSPASPKTKNKRSRNKQPQQSVYQYPNLSNPEVQKYYHQQRLFYRMIYEQQFAVLSAINASNDPNSKEQKPSSGKGNKYIPHQHLGLPPLPPPPTTSPYYPNFQSFPESCNFLEVQSPCEAAFLEHLRSHAIPRHKTTLQTLEIKEATQKVAASKQPPKILPLISRSISSVATSKEQEIEPDSLQLRADFRRQIRERLLGSQATEKQRKNIRNVVLTKEFVVGEEDFPPISGSPCSQTSSPKASKDGESGYQSETSPMMGIEREDNGCKSPCAGSTCSSPRDYSSVVAGCIPKISSEVAVEVKKEKSESEEQLSKDKIPSLPKLDSLSDSILDYYEKVAQTENTLLKKLRLRDFLYYAIAHCFPVCGLYIVGSSLNGFGNETSDMDLCLVITNRELDQRTDAIQVLRAVEQLLSLMECVKSYQLIEAKVPILRIQFKDQYEGLTVDLNANNSVAIKNTHLLCYYAFSDWRVRPLVSIVKEWAKCCNINDASQSSFTSYSLVLMVIHYLQCGLDHPILPSLQSVYPKRFHPKLDIRTLNLSMKLEPPLLPGNPCVSLGELLTGFFKYYSSTFNYETDAISVRLGKRMDRGELVNQRIQWSPICIEEPFTKFNTAHSIFDVNVFNAIKDKFQEAHDILIEASDLTELLNVQPYESPYNAYTV